MTTKQKLFCQEYILDFNATQAAIRAKYSEESAGTIGNENLQKPEIKTEISRLVTEVVGNKNKIIVENIRFWIDIRDNPESNETNRLKASEHLGKYIAMFTDKQVIDINAAIQVDKEFKIIPAKDADTK